MHQFGGCGLWSQGAGHLVQQQFTFDQESTSIVSLLDLSTVMFTRYIMFRVGMMIITMEVLIQESK